MDELPTRPRDTPIDALLRRLVPRVEVSFRSQVCGRWNIDTSGRGRMSFHIVGAGHSWLHLPDAAPRRLDPGDVLILPWDSAHVLAERADIRPRFGQTEVLATAPLDDADGGTALICGYLDVDPATRRLLRGTLPGALVVSADTEPLACLTRLLFQEAARPTPDTDPLLLRLAETLLLYVLREGMTRTPTPATGLSAALSHPRLHPALTAMLAEPERPWTVAELAQKAHLSRSGFAQRFREALGRGPIDLLTEWRMLHAHHLLNEENVGTPEVAERCGYRSEAAFARAFKRVMGYGPGEARRREQRLPAVGR
ncbi:cupin domain-containing protein [Denitromonas iodatirespirans]|uniref:AraC family transcriptional regulator n=1 Tax=Denitromonas iodatirespirans TaxID=2795389 RepID=A0A944H6E8_DENI1|nr:cupin domain-containing protein [Denitromonas iodatirespirans]MBT0960098.1 AraC family transcriptional regulator [Denitromonas iodatirespirans]